MTSFTRAFRPTRFMVLMALTLMWGHTVGCRESPEMVAPEIEVDAPLCKNIILISIDTLRPDHLGCYGSDSNTSPELDDFRQDSVLFRQAIAHAPSTLPSHASIFTSLLPSQHGASWGLKTPLPQEAETLAEVVHDGGFRTAAFTGGGQLAPQFAVDQGFDIYHTPDNEDSFKATVDAALPWIDSEPDAPFFLFLHTYEVHHPYERTATDQSYAGELPATISVELIKSINRGEVVIDDQDLDYIKGCYDAEIRSMDEAFGHLVRFLKNRQLYDQTMIVFTSDHGEEFGEHGTVGWHSHTLHDELLKVPLIIKFAEGWSRGLAFSKQVRLIDVAPTVVASLGLTLPLQFTGIDLRRLVTGQELPVLPAVSQQDSETGYSFASVRTDGWKLYPRRLFNRGVFQPEPWLDRAQIRLTSLARPFCLFDLANDAGEGLDLAAQQPAIRKELGETLESQLSMRPSFDVMTTVLDDQTNERLRALGYIE